MQQALGVPWRLELFIKSPADLRLQLPFLREANIRRVNLPNKAPEDELVACVQLLRQELPNRWRSQGWGSHPGHPQLAEPVGQQQQQQGRQPTTVPAAADRHEAAADSLAGKGGGGSGAGHSQSAGSCTWRPDLLVAFNPYLPDQAGQQAVERQRLRSKLETGLVAGVYVQIGSDLARLQSGLAFLRAAATELRLRLTPALPQSDPLPIAGSAAVAAQGLTHSGPGEGELQLLGSVLLPSRKLLAQMRFRPWSGVLLSEEYLGSVEAAEAITREVVRIYARHGVTPLIESSVRSASELQPVLDLMSLYKSAAAEPAGGGAGPAGAPRLLLMESGGALVQAEGHAPAAAYCRDVKRPRRSRA
ncbi:hypothetical protein V8C86DRAFT_800520 [Haematococcus lacustris]